MTAMQTGATIHTSSISSGAGATDTTSADGNSTENGFEYRLDVNFWKTNIRHDATCQTKHKLNKCKQYNTTLNTENSTSSTFPAQNV